MLAMSVVSDLLAKEGYDMDKRWDFVMEALDKTNKAKEEDNVRLAERMLVGGFRRTNDKGTMGLRHSQELYDLVIVFKNRLADRLDLPEWRYTMEELIEMVTNEHKSKG